MPNDDQPPQPVCFMIMPFGSRKVLEPHGSGAPSEIDCDALWDKAFRPAIEDLGYVPIRADYDPGSVIVKDMLERLALADLVLADVSLPNGNVYYEVGVRHVARETSCVLLAADWSRQLFDIEQFRSVRYPLKNGSVPNQDAARIRELVVASVPNLRAARTPYHELIDGPELDRTVFRNQAERLSAFQASVRATRLRVKGGRDKQAIRALLEGVQTSTLQIPEVATELLFLVRDHLGWGDTLGFINSLPEEIKALGFVREQKLLAMGKAGEPEEAIERLKELIKTSGDSPERQGLIGGRYKELWERARSARQDEDRPTLQEEGLLEKAIEHYSHGMILDYNQYYCSSNVAELLHERGASGDAERARVIDHFVIAACERALLRDEDDGWARPTLLGSAFRAGDLNKARELARRIAGEELSQWKLQGTLKDLARIVGRTETGATRDGLSEVYEGLKRLSERAGDA